MNYRLSITRVTMLLILLSSASIVFANDNINNMLNKQDKLREEYTSSRRMRNMDPSVIGQWDGPYEWPVVAIHAFLLPTGKVLHFSFPGEMQFPNAYTWDPVTWNFTPVPVNRPLFCSGHSFLADGGLLITGGNGPAPEGEFRGIKDAHIFDPFTETWTRIEDMADGRWYPTNVTLGDGRVLVFSGLDELTGGINADIEIYDPNSTPSWQIVDQEPLPLYPFTYVLSSGDVFYSGPSKVTGIYEINTWTWYNIIESNYGGRYGGTSVLLPPYPDRVMIIGGNDAGVVTETAEIIDFNDPNPVWQYTQSMNYPRMHANAVILPDGKILVAGGHSDMHEDKVVDSSIVYEAEIYDPTTETWSIMDSLTRPRAYHSTAVLLPDARVLIGGSDGEFTTEIFSPPYLFQGTRPVINYTPYEIAYGYSFNMIITSSTTNNSIVLIRLASVTHSVDMDQRYVHLADVTSQDGVVTVPSPANGNLAPPGYYILFVVDDDGIPSLGKIIKVRTGSCCIGIRGNIDGVGEEGSEIDIADLVYFIAYSFDQPSGPEPPCMDEADVDGSGTTDIADIVYMVDYMFTQPPGPAPEACP